MKTNSRNALLVGIWVCTGNLLLASAAHAKLEEVVVTAQKRTEALTDVPVSIAAVSTKQLAQSGINSVAGLTQAVPGLRVDFSGGYTQPTIRGVGSAIAGTGFSSNVATYVDGFYNPSQLSTDSMFLNLQSVQVLKGPQGTLFGRNATGGAILMKLRDPSFAPAFNAKASYGRFDTRQEGVYASDGLTDTLAVDFSGVAEQSDGFTHNILTGAKGQDGYNNWAARATALWVPSDDVSFKLAYERAYHRDGRPYTTNVIIDPSTGMPAALAAIIPGAVIATDRGQVSNSSKTLFKVKTEGYFLTSTFDFDSVELTSYTMYRDEKVNNYLDLDSSIPLFEGAFFNQGHTFTQEFDLSGETDNLQYVLGAYYFNSHESQNPFPLSVGGAPDVNFYHARSDIKAYALFGDGTYQFTDRWALIGGVRFSYEKSNAFFKLDPLGIAFYGPSVPGDGEPFSDSWNDISPRLGIRYQPSPDSSIYFMYSRGFKSGLLTPNSFTTKPLKPEKLSAYEIGYKYGGQENQLETSVYYYDYKDLQVANYVNGSAIYKNAASSKIYGFDAQWTTLITEQLQFNLGVAYTHARYDSFNNAPAFIQDLAVDGSGNPVNPYTFGTYVATNSDASGKRMQRSPDWTANAGLNYQIPLTAGDLHLSANYYYSSRFPFDQAGLFYQSAYGITNVRAQWNSPDDHWELALYGKNIFDKVYDAQVLPGPQAIQRTYGEPVTYGASVEYKY